MLDIFISPWIIVLILALIVLRPDDWQTVAFKGGKWLRFGVAYIQEWREYSLAMLSLDNETKKNSKVSRSSFVQNSLNQHKLNPSIKYYVPSPFYASKGGGKVIHLSVQHVA